MVMIDSDRLKFFLGAAQDAKAAWVDAGKVMVGMTVMIAPLGWTRFVIRPLSKSLA